MKMNLIDRSNYFRGALLLLKKDNKISKGESELMQRIGKALGFEKNFCANAIHDVLENKYIPDMPPRFSSKELAMKFIKDGLAVAESDNFIHPSEDHWLISIARRNGLDGRWYLYEKEKTIKEGHQKLQLEVEK